MFRSAQPELHAPDAGPLRTLGGLALAGSTFSRPKPLLLLTYLALEGAQERRHVAELFWPGAADHLKSLAVALTQLRQGAPGTLELEGRHISARVGLDVAHFTKALERENFETALEIYSGPFLDGLYVSPYGEELEAWVYETRERLADEARRALLTLAEREAASGDLAAAAKRAEAAYGLRGAPPPDAAGLERLHRLLLAGASPYATKVREEAEELGVQVTTSVQEARTELKRTGAQTYPPINLPSYTTPFIGRARELEDLEKLLAAEPNCRVLALAGPGGMGKTRLATEVAQRVTGAFPQGIFFVSLAAAARESEMVSAIAEALTFRFYSNVPPAAQLLEYLREKTLLLILDNFEGLTGYTDFVTDVLRKAPSVKLLVTTRESLRLQEEWLYSLGGLPFPEGHGSKAENPVAYDAVQLFEACARRAHIRFPLEAKEAHTAYLCQLVEGMPLALELAATWLRVLPLEAIVRSLEEGLDILATRQQNVEPRHRSLRTVLEGSWRLLGDDEKAVLQQLAVFRGGFHRKAAAHITGASLDLLSRLVEKSLLKVSEAGRYGLHELVRQFAHEKLSEDVLTFGEMKTRHRNYFRTFLASRALPLVGKGQRRALDEIAEDFDNVRAFWTSALESPDPGAIHDVLEVVYHFCEIRSRFLEGAALFTEANARLRDVKTQTALTTRVLARRGAFRHFFCEYEAAERDLLSALETARALELEEEIPFILEMLGELAAWQGQRAVAETRFEESARRYRARGDHDGAACALENLANLIYATFGDYETSKKLAAESIALSRELERPDLIAYALDTLGFATFCLGEYTGAEHYYCESLHLFEGSGDRYGTAMATGGVALVLWAIGGDRAPVSAEYFTRSLQLCQEIGHKGQAAGRLAGLARVANDLGQFQQARDYALRGLELSTDISSPVYLGHLLCCLGETAYRTGELRVARTQLLRALEVSLSSQLLPHLAMTLYHYAELRAREGEAEKSSAYKQALELAALVSAHPVSWQVYRDRAARLRTELEKAVPDSLAADAWGRSEKASLEAVARTLILKGRAEERSFSPGI